MAERAGDKVAGSLIWKFLERGGVQIVQFIISMVIARLLSPSAYGSVALITVFVNIATNFVRSGLNTALIQKKDPDSVDQSSVFYYSLFIAIICYVVLYVCSDYIAEFYQLPILKDALRVMALTLFPGAFNSIQVAVLSKRMQFKLQFYSGMIAAVLSGLIGIAMAAYGFGVWALVVQQLSYQVVICIVLWFVVKWRPTLEFSFQKTKTMLAYGSKILVSNLLLTVYSSVENLIIGKKYSEAHLALFSKGKQFPAILIDNMDNSVQSVMFVAYSKDQENVEKIKGMVRKTVALNTYLIFPAMLGLAVVAESLILLLLGEAWLGCVEFLRVYCLSSMLLPMQTATLQAINATGRADVYLKVNVTQKIIGIVLVFCAVLVSNSVMDVAYASLLSSLLSVIICVFPATKILKYSARELITDTTPNFMLSAVMTIVTVAIGSFIKAPLLKMLVQLMVGSLIYILISHVVKNKNYVYLKGYIFTKLMTKKLM